METYLAALDQGTTTSRAILFNSRGEIVAKAQYPFRQIFPQPGWVEHDPMEIWATTSRALSEAVDAAHIDPKAIAGIGITNQRETAILWDRRTGQPVYNAIVWQCRRTAEICDRLKADGLGETVTEKTGLLIDAYFSGTKLKWIMEHVPGVRQRAERGELCAGTVDSWLIWNLTSGKVHATDVTNASRTMLFNINSLSWDSELLDLFGIPESMMPQVRSSDAFYGEATVLGHNIPITGVAGDQQAALFGQMCIDEGSVKNTYGTGCFLLMNCGDKPILSENRLLTTVAWKLKDKVNYALEGSIFVAGAAVQWLRDGLGLIKNSSDIEALASSVTDNGGVYFVPALTGMGAPYWNQDVRGVITGLTRGATAAHIARATLEGIAFQTMDIVAAMERDAGILISELKVDGGASRNNLLMQFQADILGTEVIRPKVTEITGLGAAYMAGLGAGIWSSMGELQNNWEAERRFSRRASESRMAESKAAWAAAVRKALAE